MNTLFDVTFPETECKVGNDGEDLSYWALFTESVQPELRLATPVPGQPE